MTLSLKPLENNYPVSTISIHRWLQPPECGNMWSVIITSTGWGYEQVYAKNADPDVALAEAIKLACEMEPKKEHGGITGVHVGPWSPEEGNDEGNPNETRANMS